MHFIDTHCHLHDPKFFSAADAKLAVKLAVEKNVSTMLCIGTSLEDSKQAITFATANPKHCYASIGIHPHEAAKLSPNEINEHLKQLSRLAQAEQVVAIGECGFDFFYNEKSENLKAQEQLLRGQLEIANKHNLPMSFHVRQAFADFWRVLDDFPNIRGVLHSFTDTKEHLDEAVRRGLFIGVNGIATFTKSEDQIKLFRTMPLKAIVVETDAPFLTPEPKRGKINTSENVTYITKFMAELRGETVELFVKNTTANAKKLFNFS